MKKLRTNLMLGGVLLCLMAIAGLTSCNHDLSDHFGVSDNPSPGVTDEPTPITNATPLTFEAKTAGAVVTFKVNNDDVAKDIEYSTDGGTTWTAGNTGGTGVSVTLANIGDKVMFRGTNATYAGDPPIEKYNSISCTEDCYVYGNVMSLINKDNYATNKELTAEYAFSALFLNNANIYSHDTKTLELPATTLKESCYNEMFMGCTKLTKAPALPATALTVRCYNKMFFGCTSLTTAPDLPAPTLASSCYNAMFQGCIGLTTTPVLNVDCNGEMGCMQNMFNGCTGLTTVAAGSQIKGDMAINCCSGMFSGCTILASVPVGLLPSLTLGMSCYINMFNGCEALTTAPALPATTLVTSCYDSMFKGCIALTETPKLPAETTVLACYNHMFEGCTSLNVAWVKAAFSDTNCYNMFYQCDATGAVLHTQAGNVGGWYPDPPIPYHAGSFVADDGWVD